VADQKYSQNCHPFASHKMTDPQEDFQGEGSPEEGDSLEEEYLEVEEDTWEVEEAHQEEHHPEEDGDPHLF